MSASSLSAIRTYAAALSAALHAALSAAPAALHAALLAAPAALSAALAALHAALSAAPRRALRALRAPRRARRALTPRSTPRSSPRSSPRSRRARRARRDGFALRKRHENVSALFDRVAHERMVDAGVDVLVRQQPVQELPVDARQIRPIRNSLDELHRPLSGTCDWQTLKDRVLKPRQRLRDPEPRLILRVVTRVQRAPHRAPLPIMPVAVALDQLVGLCVCSELLEHLGLRRCRIRER